MLTARQIESAKGRDKNYKMADAGGLYLLVMPNGARYWRVKYRIAGKEKTLALGVYPTVGLKEARQAAQEAKKAISQGIDPTAAKHANRRAREAADAATFNKLAERWFARWRPGKSDGTADNVARQVGFLVDLLGEMPVASIKAAEIVQAVEKIESVRGNNPARRCLRLAGEILAYGVARGELEVNVTAGIGKVLPEVKGGHRAAVVEQSGLGEALRAVWGYRDGVVGRAMRLLPLLFCRPSELAAMRWADLSGLDGDMPEWRYQISKTDTPQIVPLSRQAVEIILSMKGGREREWVFPARKGGGHIMATTIATAMKRQAALSGTQTAHGWRATARTILDEQLGFRPDWIEAQLGHVVRDTNGRAYNRTTHLDGRRTMMQAWADYLDGLREGSAGDDNVVPLRRAG